MIFKITSLNSKLSAGLRPKAFFGRKLYGLALIMTFLSFGSQVFGQIGPPSISCPAAIMDLTLPPGDGGLVLDAATILVDLGVVVVEPDGTPLTFTAVPATIDCSNIGIGVDLSVTITVDDLIDGSDMCNITINNIHDGGPFADCVDFTADLTGATVTVFPGDIDGGSSACSGIAPIREISKDGIVYSPEFVGIDFDCTEVGDHDVFLRVTDNLGAMAVCSSVVTVDDSADPTLTCVGNQTRDTDPAACTYTVVGAEFDLTASADNCMFTVTNDFNSMASLAGAVFPQGTTTVIWTATDASMNAATCSYTVTVNDNQAPDANGAGTTVSLGMTNPGMATLAATTINSGSTDNCPTSGLTFRIGLAAIGPFTTTIDFDCSDVGTVDVWLQADDGSNTNVDGPYTVTVQDVTDPVITCPGDITIGTDGTVISGSLTNYGVISAGPTTCEVTVNYTISSTDNCTATNSQTDISGLTSGNDFPIGTTTQSWRATDASGRTDNCTFTITVVDNQIPTFTPAMPADITINSSADGTGNCSGQANWNHPTVNDVCTGPVVLTVEYEDDPGNIITIPSGGPASRTFPVGAWDVTYVVCDAVMPTPNCNTVTFEVRVDDDEDPVALCQNVTLQLDANGMATLNVNDIDNGSSDNCNAVTLSLAPLLIPAPGPFCNESGVGAGFPSDPGCEAAICAADPFCCSIFWDGICASAANFEPACAGCLNTAPPITVPPTLTLDFDCSQVGANTVTLHVLDDEGNEVTCDATVTVEDNIAPTISCPGGAPITTATFNNPPLVPIDVIDDAYDGSLGSMSSHTINVAGIPPGITVLDIQVDLNATHTWIGDLTLKLESPDNVILGLMSRPGLLEAADDGNGCCGSSANLDGTTISFSDAGVTDANFMGITIGTGQAVCTDDNDCFFTPNPETIATPPSTFAELFGGTLNGDWTLYMSDAVGGDIGTIVDWSLIITYSDGSTQNITVNNDPGVCGATVTFPDPVVDDNCPGSTVTLLSGLTSGSVFPVGTTTNTYQVTDASGNTDVCSFDVIVSDTEAPGFSGFPMDATLTVGATCVATHTWTNPTATDNCSANIISQTHTSPTTFPLGVTTISYTVQDASGNTSSQSFTVTVQDTGGTPPTAECEPTVLNFDVNGQATFTVFDIDDGSTDNCGVPTLSMLIDLDGNGVYGNTAAEGPFTSGSPKVFDCSEAGTYNVQLTASDGNPSPPSCISTVTVTDNSDPIATCQAATINVSIAADGSPAVVTTAMVDDGSKDNCGIVSMTLNGQPSLSFDCTQLGTHIVTFVVTDAAGLSSNCTATVVVSDTDNPVLVNIPNDVTASCGSIPPPSTLVAANDNCGIQGINFNETDDQVGNPSTCGDYEYTITRTWTATDLSGNTAVATQIITVEDDTAPFFLSGAPAIVNVDANISTCDAFVSFSLTSSDYFDACAGTNVTLTNNSPVGNGTNDASGTYGVGTHIVTYTITDPCGNSATADVTINVNDNVAPVALCSSTTIAIPSGADSVVILPSYIDNGSFDNCGPVTLSVSPASFDCTELGAQSVVLTAFDAMGIQSGSCAATVTVQDLTPPDVVCQNITVSLDGMGNATITPADVTASASDACSGLASTSIDVSTFDASDLGPNSVILTGTDNSGNSASCTAIVTIIPAPTCFEVGNGVGGAGEIISVPVTVTDFTAITSFQFTLFIESDLINFDSVAEFVGITSNNPMLQPDVVVNPQADSVFVPVDTLDVQMPLDSIVFDTTLFFNTMSVSWLADYNLTGGPVSLADNETIFEIEFLLTGNINDFSLIKFEPNSIGTPKEVVYDLGGTLVQDTDPCTLQGAVLINELVIAGEVFNEYGSSVALADVQLWDLLTIPFPTKVDSMETMTDGLFSFNINSTSDYELVPVKTVNWSNGIDILDVQKIQAHAVGVTYVNSGYKKIAADVNDDGIITTFDAVLLNQYFNSLFTLPPPPNDSWRFVDAKFMLPNTQDALVPFFPETIGFSGITSDTMGNDFVAVKIGDIDGLMADTTMLTGGSADGNNAPLEFIAVDQSLKAGNAVQIDLSAENFNNLVAYQWALEFDPTQLNFEGFEAGELVNVGNKNFGLAFEEQGLIIVTWYNETAVSASADAQLFTLNFEALQGGAKLSDVIRIKQLEGLQAKAYDASYDAGAVSLRFEEGEVAVAFELYQNQPNPFKSQTTIGFTLPEATTAKLTIQDVTGRVLRVYEQDFAKGYNEVSLSRDDIPASGLLYYQLETTEHSATRKMIVVE